MWWVTGHCGFHRHARSALGLDPVRLFVCLEGVWPRVGSLFLDWIGSTPRKNGGLGQMNIPLISDPTRIISNDYGVLIKDAGIALRGLFVIDPEGVVQQVCAPVEWFSV
jgi:hypothetical protein